MRPLKPPREGYWASRYEELKAERAGNAANTAPPERGDAPDETPLCEGESDG